MDREHHIARFIVDIDDDIGDQCPQQLLAGTHRHTWCIPGHRQIVHQVGEGAWVDFDIRSLLSGQTCLQLLDTPERSLPILLQLCGDETIIWIAGRVATLG